MKQIGRGEQSAPRAARRTLAATLCVAPLEPQARSPAGPTRHSGGGAEKVPKCCLVLGFSSGAAHKSAGSVPHVQGLTRPTYALRSMEILDEVILAMRRLHQPIIAAVNGAAIGGGLCLALAADIRVAASDAYFRAAGINNGLTASELGLSYLLPRAIGRARAMEMALLGEKIGAAKALEWGLVNRVVPDADLRATAIELAKELANGPASLGAIRTLIWESLDTDWTGQLQAERKAQKIAGKSEDFIEGVSAFLQKRVAAFKGR
jgi:enoyl-CoA hydratase/carnithine racemase